MKPAVEQLGLVYVPVDWKKVVVDRSDGAERRCELPMDLSKLKYEEVLWAVCEHYNLELDNLFGVWWSSARDLGAPRARQNNAQVFRRLHDLL